MLQLVEQTIGALHQFFEDWMQGRIANTPENLQHLETVFADDFKIVTPTGALQNREQVIADIKNGWGAIPGIKIWIKDVLLLHEDTSTVVALYKEHQSLSRHLNTRTSTAVFKKQAGSLSWFFVHETFCRMPELTTGQGES
jgi:hypothetical protein